MKRAGSSGVLEQHAAQPPVALWGLPQSLPELKAASGWLQVPSVCRGPLRQLGMEPRAFTPINHEPMLVVLSLLLEPSRFENYTRMNQGLWE